MDVLKELLDTIKNNSIDNKCTIENVDLFVKSWTKEAESLQLRKADVSGSTSKQKPIWTDYLLNRFRWYRKWRKCTWYKHQFTSDALELSNSFTGTWWALYGKINRYSDVIDTEVW